MRPQTIEWGRGMPHLVAAGVLCLLTSATARAQLPATLNEAALLGSADLGEGLQVGLYGPRLVAPEEPAVLLVVLLGSEQVAVASGVVLLSAPRGMVDLEKVPIPAGTFVSAGQWMPGLEVGGERLLVLNADAQWVTPLAIMAPLGFVGGPGRILDVAVFGQPWAHPPPNVRNEEQLHFAGVAFCTLRNMDALDSSSQGHGGARSVVFSFPISFRGAEAAVSVWVACTANGKQASGYLTATLAARSGNAPPSEGAEQAPRIYSPIEGESVPPEVKVVGRTSSPGALVVAWLEGDLKGAESKVKSKVVRRISAQDGTFSLVVSMPLALRSRAADCLLHIHTEAPGYRSPECVRRLHTTASP